MTFQHFVIIICIIYDLKYIRSTIHVLPRCHADVVIAGLFPLRRSSNEIPQQNDAPTSALARDNNCNASWDANGVQEALAMLHAVSEINKNDKLLPNVKVGVDILNTCDQSHYAIKSCLQFDFVKGKYDRKSQDGKTVAIVGVRKSSVARSISTLTQLFEIPTISYGATDHTLSDIRTFPYFARTIPSNEQLVKAIVDLLDVLDWNIVFVIYDQTDYARSAFQLFQAECMPGNTASIAKRKRRVCIAYSTSINELNIRETVEDIKQNIINKHSSVSAFIVFAQREKATKILMHALDVDVSNYSWILSDGFSNTYEFKRSFRTHDLGNSVISFRPKRLENDDDSLLLDFQSFVERHIENSELYDLIPELRGCLKQRCLYLGMEPIPIFSRYLPYVIDAVYVVGHALHSMYKCDQEGGCNLNQSRKHLWDKILDVSFTGKLNYTIKLNEKGNVFGQYQLTLIKKTRKDLETFPEMYFKSEGIWDGSTRSYDGLSIRIKNLSRSSCREECIAGQKVVQINQYDGCCSKCKQCEIGTYSNTTNSESCLICPNFYTANLNRDSCIQLQKRFVKYDSVLGTALISLSAVGYFFVFISIFIYLKYRETHIIKAASCEVSLLMLIGSFFCFTSSYLIVGPMSDLKCQMTIVVSGFSLSLLIGALLVKTNRVYRIFDKNILRKGLPKFLSIFWQRTIILIIIIIDVGLSSTIAFFPYDRTRYQERISENVDVVYTMCYYNTNLISIWWVFHCVMVLFCTYQAILARKVPGNYNEARNIMISMLAISLEIIFLVPNFYYDGFGFHRQLILTFINIVSAISTMLFMFFPKIFVICFRPWENQEDLPHGHMGFFLQDNTIIATVEKKTKLARNGSITSQDATRFDSMGRLRRMKNKKAHEENKKRNSQVKETQL